MPAHVETGKRFKLIPTRQQCRERFGDIRQICPLMTCSGFPGLFNDQRRVTRFN